MAADPQPVAVRPLFSFPHKIGADRICHIAWHQVVGVRDAGGEMLVYPGAVHRPLPPDIRVRATLGRGRLRIPYRAVGSRRAFALHDAVVARRLARLAGQIDVVHVWPLGARRTLEVARELRIPTVLERPNAHTRYAYSVVRDECERIGVPLPPDHEHAFNEAVLRAEEEEYALADYLLCPSEFVVRTFLDEGFAPGKLLRHTYGFEEGDFHPDGARKDGEGLTMLFVGVAAVRKGLHLALDAWLRSPASRRGTFLVAGEVLPAYAERLASALEHPSVRLLGHRTDVPDLMRQADVLVLPSIEEGFGLVCVEALGSGCVPLVSEACTDACTHMENALVHRIGDVAALEAHITSLDEDRELLRRLRAGALASAPEYTWTAAGARLADVYRQVAGRPAPR